jgi:RND family efflux transporter MFP subunit
MPRESLHENLEALRIDHSHRSVEGPPVPKWIWWALAVMVVALLSWGLSSVWAATPVSVARPVVMEVSEAAAVLVAGGYVVAHHKIQLSSKVIGKVAWIGVEKGDTVQQGQVLVRLEDQEYRAALEQARGNLASAEARLRQLETGSRPEEIERARAQAAEAAANLENARLNWQRIEGLFKEGVASVQERDNARAAHDMARAQNDAAHKNYELVRLGPRREEIDFARGQVEQARGALNFAQTQLESTEIRAPVGGTILERLVEKGEMVTTSFVGERGAKSSVVSIADLNDLQVELDINQQDFARIKSQQKCLAVPDAYPDRKYNCAVDEIAPEANRQKATVQVKVKILNPDGLLRPEMNAKVSFLEEGGGAVKSTQMMVPRGAVFQAEGRSAVLVVENQRAVRKAVSLGDYTGDNVRVLSGLTGSETLIVSNPAALRDGQRVRVR